MKFAHTNIITKDWKRLSQFYVEVFECIPVPPVRSQSGKWLEEGTGVPNASLEGIHLRLPGYDDHGPTLEIYQYSNVISSPPAVANRCGIGHLAFVLDDVDDVMNKVKENGGKAIGSVSETLLTELGPEQNQRLAASSNRKWKVIFA